MLQDLDNAERCVEQMQGAQAGLIKEKIVVEAKIVELQARLSSIDEEISRIDAELPTKSAEFLKLCQDLKLKQTEINTTYARATIAQLTRARTEVEIKVMEKLIRDYFSFLEACGL